MMYFEDAQVHFERHKQVNALADKFRECRQTGFTSKMLLAAAFSALNNRDHEVLIVARRGYLCRELQYRLRNILDALGIATVGSGRSIEIIHTGVMIQFMSQSAFEHGHTLRGRQFHAVYVDNSVF